MKLHNRTESFKGAALVGALLIVFIISIIVVFTLSYVTEIQRTTTQKIRNEQAFQVAEAGLYLAVDWINQWLDYYPSGPAADILPGGKNYDAIREFAWREEMTGKMDAPTQFITSEYTLLDKSAGFNDSYGVLGEISASDGGSGSALFGFATTAYAVTAGNEYRGRVWKLKVLPPTTALPTIPPGTSQDDMYNIYFKGYPLMRVQSVGRAEDNRTEAIVEADISLLRYGGIVVPAALVAGANVTNNGQFNLHWGQAWAKTSMYVPKPGTQVVKWTQDTLTKYTDDGGNTRNDPWVALKTVKFIFDQNGSWWDGTSWLNTVPDPATAPQVMFPTEALPLYEQWDRTPLSAGRLAVDPADWLLGQTIDDLINSFNYDRFKEIALERGQYYYPDSSGKLYDANGTKVYDNIDGITFYKGGTFDDSKVKADVIFIDTLDRQPPNALGTNLATLVLSGGGSGFYSKGLLYICGNLDVRGMNKPSPGPIAMLNPYEYENGLSSTLSRYLWHQGVLFIAGNMYGLRGTSTLYGSIVIKGRYLGEGTPDVYYMPQLKSGEAFPFSSKAVILNWRKKTKWYNWS
jgi:hypothetical protein